MTCINCSTEGEGRFCSNCSQPLKVKRLSWKESLLDFWARIYGFDGMFPRTFKDLTFRPGYASLQFIKGNRARYYGPVGYFFLMITCFLLLLSILGLNYVDYLQSMQAGLPVQQEENELNRDIRDFVADNLKLVAFIVIPFQAFVARYIFFRKQGFNFLEHSVMPLYITGHWYWLQMVEAIYFNFTRISIGTMWQALFMAVYMGFGYISFVPSQPKWKTFLKGFSIYFVSFIFFMIFIMIMSIIFFLIVSVVNPEYFETLRPSNAK